MNNYQEIINLPHHTSKKHPRMSMRNRAAQFAPFAALTGYDEAVVEAGRLTNEKIELSDDEREVINSKIKFIKEHIEKKIKVKITYYIADQYKDGGGYQVANNIVKKIDECNQIIIMEDKMKILMSNIIDIEIDKDKCID